MANSTCASLVPSGRTSSVLFGLSIAVFAIAASSSCGGGASHPRPSATASVTNKVGTATASPQPGKTSPADTRADVYVGGTIVAVSTQELDVRGMESNVPIIQIKLEDTEDAFFRQSTRPLLALSLTEAAPRVGEDVCVLARLHSNGDLVAWLVFLESECQHNP
jgi:hypothetical protein